MAETPDQEGHRRGEGLVLALAFVAAVVRWPVRVVSRAVRCRRYRRAIAGSVTAGSARRDESGHWTVQGQYHGRAEVAVRDVVTVRWVVFDNGIMPGPTVDDLEGLLFELELRGGETVRLHADAGQLDSLRDELGATGLLPNPERRPGCVEWNLSDMICCGIWLVVILAVLAWLGR